MQSASECQDAVTTRQDHGQTFRDVFANMKASPPTRGSVEDPEREAVRAPGSCRGGCMTAGRSSANLRLQILRKLLHA